MATYASVADVLERHDGPTTSEPRISVLLNDAEAILTAEMGSISSRITDGETTADRVRIVLCNMVIRVLRNPTGLRQESVGPFSYSHDPNVSSGRLYLTKDDRRLLGLRRRAVSMAMEDSTLKYPVRNPWCFDDTPWIAND